MMEKPRKIRCKSRHGISCRWVIGPVKDGGYQILMMGKAKIRNQPIPLDFVPFELSNAVMNSPTFKTLDDAEVYVRSL